MYKVFVNDKPLFLASSKEVKDIADYEFYMIHTSISTLQMLVDMMEKFSGPRIACVSHENIETLWEDFTSGFHYIESAGGVVKNKNKEILLINRYSKWDLPKGKLEKGEKPDEAAIREVEEECGLDNLTIIKELPSTYHTFQINGNKKLKRTFWYEMECSSKKMLVPQREEGIIDARWMKPHEAAKASKNTYNSIVDLIAPAGL